MQAWRRCKVGDRLMVKVKVRLWVRLVSFRSSTCLQVWRRSVIGTRSRAKIKVGVGAGLGVSFSASILFASLRAV